MIKESAIERLIPHRVGVVLALLTLAFGFGLGGAFGAREDAMKAGLRADAEKVLDAVYGGDHTAMTKVTDKAWVYYKRAHLHANGLGATSLALILLLAALPAADRIRTAVSTGLGAGALGYSIFWLLAGMRAPGLGSTGAAKETLQWLAIPSSGLCLIGLLAVLVVAVRALFLQRDAP
ncbi:MAG TPA: hypothetical protein QF604_14005 [Candidatus Latescibacteria bacterium]|jgi:hypothetical protein|nr:hypothetical protein [Candidatus Latescibacterota bacterium]MDP7635474.1 hypothetical protein [Candidatus Latescibacterota bacterium]HJN29022.1 hypothetical protein [Candidatus Latescibacterota bacterium]|tara:strand:+ start:1620 stop:2153 length:534 start_codon:yes stop_codon:yes gene_type:complete